MAEEGTLGLARALETEEDETKADLQRRMEEARESISQTVTEIRDTVTNQYQVVKENVSEALDWRTQFKKRPIAWTVGALGVGIVVGYKMGGLIGSGDEPASLPFVQTEGGGPSAFSDDHAYAAHARAVAAMPQTDIDDAQSLSEVVTPRPSYSSGYTPAPSEPDKPGLIERFKETRAYDRLQEEVGDLGNRFMDELSNAARTIVLPALFNKLKEMIGVDLSNKRDAGSSALRESRSRTGESPDLSATPRANVEAGTNAATPSANVIDSRNKFDRLADHQSQMGDSENGPGNNSSYDDRYERESKLFTRGENRGFGARSPAENKDAASDARRKDDPEVPRGANYTFEPGRGPDADG